MDAIVVKDLKKQYKKGPLALNNVDLKIKKGEIFGLLGPNGAGKSTLIHCITNLATITDGNINVFGYDVVTEHINAKLQIGLSPQDLKFDMFFSLEEILVYQAGYFGQSKEFGKKRARELLKHFDLYDKRKKMVHELSGGMKRKFSLAKAMIHKPKILILDEPTAALDVDARVDLWKYIKKINNDGVTVLLTTHYLEEAEELADRICIINKGKVVKLENKKDIMDKLSQNVIRFSFGGKFSNKSLVKNYETRIHGHVLDVIVSRKDQNRVLKEIIEKFDKNKVEYHNFEIQEDKLENIFLRIVKNGGKNGKK